MPGVPKRLVNSGETVLLVKFLRRYHIAERLQIASVIKFLCVFQCSLNQLVRNSGASRFGNAIHFLQLTNSVNSDKRRNSNAANNSVRFGYSILFIVGVIYFGESA